MSFLHPDEELFYRGTVSDCRDSGARGGRVAGARTRADRWAHEQAGGRVLPEFEEIRPLLVAWDEERQVIMPQNLPPGQKPLVLVTRDESTFNANDGKRRPWMNGK